MLSEVKSILSIAQKIYGVVQQGKANQQQCQRLSQRIEIVMSALRGLERVPANENFQDGLRLLRKTLYDGLEFVKKFAGRNWFRRVINGGTDSKKFASLTEELRRSSELLQLGMVAQQMINHEEDKQDEAEDHQAILNNQAAIIALAKEELLEQHKLNQQQKNMLQQQNELQQGQQQLQQQGAALQNQAEAIRLEEIQENFVINQQLASMQDKLDKILRKEKTKPLISKHLNTLFYELSINQLVTVGKAGNIYFGYWLQIPVAIKMFSGHRKKAALKRFSREVEIMSRLRNPYITQIYAACLEPDRVCLVMEYMSRGSLYDAIANLSTNEDEKHNFILTIARGLYYLHAKGVLHMDLNSHNLLLNEYNQVKITNFGFAKVRAESIATLGTERQSTVAWMAPERFKRNCVTTAASDIYSLGVIMWELFSGKHPFSDDNDANIVDKVSHEVREELDDNIPIFYQELITQCWQHEPQDRPTLKTIIQRLEQYQPELIHTQRLPSPTAEIQYQQATNLEAEGRYEEAAYAYQRALSKGNMRAHANIAAFFQTGKGGVEKNPKEAFEHTKEAAEHSHPRSMYNLARRYEKGDGAEASSERAIHWYQKALDCGVTQAKVRLEKLGVKNPAPNTTTTTTTTVTIV